MKFIKMGALAGLLAVGCVHAPTIREKTIINASTLALEDAYLAGAHQIEVSGKCEDVKKCPTLEAYNKRWQNIWNAHADFVKAVETGEQVREQYCALQDLVEIPQLKAWVLCEESDK